MTSEKAVPPTIETIFRPGQNVAGKYCLDHPIAAGDRGEVWAGHDLRTRKRIALKVFSHLFASTPGERELFRREALAASCIIHPNLVTVFDVVDHAAKPCIAMELLQGQDLGTYLARQRLPTVEETVALLVPAMHAMAAANARGVFHRALRPRNIFLCIGPDGRPTTTKVLNLGTSLVAAKAIQQCSKTVQFIPRRTRAYASLDKDTGASTLDEQSDVYGFGVTLFEALAGQPPYVGAAGAELSMRIAEEPVPKLTRFRPDLYPEMDEIIARATARNPNDRFPTLDDFIATLLWEQVLPPSPMLRHAREVVEAPLLATGSGPTKLADPVAGVARCSAPSEEPDAGITRALLYVLSRADSEKQEQSDELLPPPQVVSHQQPEPQPLADRTRSARSLKRGDDDTDRLVLAFRGRARLWSLLAVISIAGAVAVVAWFVIPTRPRPPQGGGQSEAITTPVSTGKSQPIALPAREVAAPTARGQSFASDEEAPTNVPATLRSHSEARRRAANPTFRPTEPTLAGPRESALTTPPAGNFHRAGQLSSDDF